MKWGDQAEPKPLIYWSWMLSDRARCGSAARIQGSAQGVRSKREKFD